MTKKTVGRTKVMKTNRTKGFCGLLALLALTACSSNQNEGTSDSHLWHVTLNASMGDATRALSEGENNVLTASFAENDEVVMIDADGSTIVGTLTAKTAGTSTTLEGTLDATTLTVNEEVTLHYRSATANYDGQNGTLSGIAANQDYAVGTLTVATTDPLTFESNSVTLAAQQSITKFSFKEGGSNDVYVKTFGIAATGLVQSMTAKDEETVGAVTGTLSTASTQVYVALRNRSNDQQTYSFYIQDGSGNWYTGTKKANLANGSNYAATVALTKLNNLTASSVVGTIGVIGGRPAIVASINGTKKAVALMNDGALCPEAYGTYRAFDKVPAGVIDNGWYIPRETDLDGLDDNTYAWRTQNGVDGCLFTIDTDHTLFLPAAGFYDNEYNPNSLSNAGTGGFYWSSTDNNDDLFASILHFNNSGINNYTTIDYKKDYLSIRRFHALP